ncbi:MAG TPA: serine--tRNA ligase [Bacteroidia bacterium]|nr:serine--tRNA ligase [Bacteroidia bacterium]
MLLANYLRENKEDVKTRLQKKNFKQLELVDLIIDKDNDRKKIQNQLDENLAQGNKLAEQIGGLMKAGKKEEAAVLKTETAQLKEKSKELQTVLETCEKELHDMLVQLPNLPHDSVPQGITPAENEVVFSHGNIPKLHDKALPHWDLCSKYDIIDFELGVKLTGAGFPVYKGKGAKLQRALINFFLDKAAEAGYSEVQPPILVNADSGYGTGQLPDKEGQMYYVGMDDYYLIPTAEVPVTNIYRDLILKAEDLPIKNTAYTPCFRREAGSYGKDVRGLNRLHQFDKVEIVQIQHPDKSYETLEEMRQYVAGLLEQLNLPFRTLRLCGGDMSFASALTYDMEVYSAAQEKWLEVSSVSNFESFQANRLKLRYREGSNKPVLAHTLNGSALALPRIVAAILENNQTPDGIKVPEVLIKYLNFDMIN